MKKAQVHVNGRYTAKVSGGEAVVRITGESRYGGWDAVNEKTGRSVRIRSAQRLRNTVIQPLLALADLDAALARDDHHGWGYATRRYLGTIVQRRLDEAVIEVANELGLTADDLFEWADSKYGRWLVDAVYGRAEPARADIVRGWLNRDALDRLKAEEELPEDEDTEAVRLQQRPRLSAQDAGAIAEALELLAGLDEGEHTDYGELMRLSGVARAIARGEVEVEA